MAGQMLASVKGMSACDTPNEAAVPISTPRGQGGNHRTPERRIGAVPDCLNSVTYGMQIIPSALLPATDRLAGQEKARVA